MAIRWRQWDRKEYLAMALAEEMHAELHHIPSQNCNLQTISDVIRMCWYAPMSGSSFHLVLVDEADQMSNAAQLALLSKLDSTDPPPNTIFVFTANDVDRLEKRFLSRTRVLEFSTYGMRSPLAVLLAEVWEKETGKAGELNWERIAKDANGNVREALSVLELELLAQ